jgi:hypothetical protein
MQSAYIVTGTLTDDRTVTLDEDVALAPARVRVIIEPGAVSAARSARDVLAGMWAAQDARGYVARTREQVDAELERERNSWGD